LHIKNGGVNNESADYKPMTNSSELYYWLFSQYERLTGMGIGDDSNDCG